MLNDADRTALIRKGNEAFNNGEMELAAKIYKSTEYKDGLIRMGDYYYFNQRQPLIAYGYYRRANHTIMMDRLSDNFINALKFWLADPSKGDEEPPPAKQPPEPEPTGE